MGVMDWFKQGTSELMVARPDGAKAQVVWKHPDPTIPTMAQLTVEADEVALFFKDGKVVGTLQPGRHTLDTANIPFFSNLIDSFTGGNVLISEVFFVNTREHVGARFGGRIGHVEDPKSGVPVETLVHGEFSFRVVDPEQLVIGLVGMGRAESFAVKAWLKEQVLKVMRDRVAETLVKRKWPLLDVTSGAYTEELEQEVLTGLDAHVAPYGLSIVRLGNFVVGMDEDDSEHLKTLYRDAAYLRTVGGVEKYQRFAAGKAFMGAGEGMAAGTMGGGGGDGGGGGGGNLAAGASLGIGLGMAQMLIKDNAGGDTLAPVTAGVVCGSCQASVAPGKFCSQCGGALKPPVAASPLACSGCGEAMAPDAKFCPSCGGARG